MYPEQQISAMGALRSLATTQTQVDVFSDLIIETVQSGQVDPLEVLVQLRAMEKASERILKAIRENILTSADKYSEKTFELFGNKLTKSEVGVKFDYTCCADSVWARLDAIANGAIEQRKDREAFLRGITKPVTIVDESTGEVMTVSPPCRTSTSTITVSIK